MRYILLDIKSFFYLHCTKGSLIIDCEAVSSGFTRHRPEGFILKFQSELDKFYLKSKMKKLMRFLRCTVACFVYRITQKISDILWARIENGWICILNCVSWFVSIILNFNALCNAYTVHRHYTVLLKRKKIFCLILEIIFRNYIFTISY